MKTSSPGLILAFSFFLFNISVQCQVYTDDDIIEDDLPDTFMEDEVPAGKIIELIKTKAKLL